MVIGVTFSLAACENKEQAKEVKKKSGMTKEEAEEEVKYWPEKGYRGLSCFINGDIEVTKMKANETSALGPS